MFPGMEEALDGYNEADMIEENEIKRKAKIKARRRAERQAKRKAKIKADKELLDKLIKALKNV